jgi:hypothetical protein
MIAGNIGIMRSELREKARRRGDCADGHVCHLGRGRVQGGRAGGGKERSRVGHGGSTDLSKSPESLRSRGLFRGQPGTGTGLTVISVVWGWREFSEGELGVGRGAVASSFVPWFVVGRERRLGWPYLRRVGGPGLQSGWPGPDRVIFRWARQLSRFYLFLDHSLSFMVKHDISSLFGDHWITF